jgi:hypothetical protein
MLLMMLLVYCVLTFVSLYVSVCVDIVGAEGAGML